MGGHHGQLHRNLLRLAELHDRCCYVGLRQLHEHYGGFFECLHWHAPYG